MFTRNQRLRLLADAVILQRRSVKRLKHTRVDGRQSGFRGVVYPHSFSRGACMTLKIDVIKDKILSENYFVLRNITYD